LQKSSENCALAHFPARIDWENTLHERGIPHRAQVAEMLGVSEDTVRRLFFNEPGVIDLGQHETSRGKRRYRVLRIPSAVVARFLERRSVK